MFTIRTMHHSSTSEMPRKVIVAGMVRSCGRVGHSRADTDRRRIFRMRSNKSSVLPMSAEATTTRATSGKFVVVVSNATCLTQSDRGPQNSSWQGARGTLVFGLEHHTGGYLVALGIEPRPSSPESDALTTRLPMAREICKCSGFIPSLPRCSKSPQLFGHSPRPDHRPSDGYYYRAPKHIHLQSCPLGRRYASASVRVTSGSTSGSHISQPSVRPPAMLLSPHLMAQNGVPVSVFSMTGTDESHTELSLVNRGDVEAR
ncbi:hypothetical protein TNCV_2896791 [Trichonephila clavipes]|nr:hypothetical protein TNCV_2896791 [Trichonephila clavipes]